MQGDPNRPGLRPLSSNVQPTGILKQNSLLGEKVNTSASALLGNFEKKRIAFAPDASENNNPDSGAAQGQQLTRMPSGAGRSNKRTSLVGWQDDLAKLRSEFDSLQQQLHQMPRRESVHAGHGGASMLVQGGPQQAAPQPAFAAAAAGLSLSSSFSQAPAAAPIGISLGSAAPVAAPVPVTAPAHKQGPLPAAHPPLPSSAAGLSMHHAMSAPAPLQKPPLPMASAGPAMPVLQAAIPQAPAPVAQPPLPSMAAFSGQAADLAARAAAMADCPLGSRESSPGERFFQFPSNVPQNSKTWKAAHDVFEDGDLAALCEEGLNKQLQRTKDGATEQSRIQELAGLVKLLRKCLREMGSRTSMYVDQCIKVEKELLKQVETTQLSSESTVKALEAELAGAKKSLAGFEASFKADKASWGADLEAAKYEVLRLKRELERVTEERDEAREEGKRSDLSRQQLEVELKELRKTASQQIREVALSQSEAVRSANEEKAAMERREAGLREESSRMTARLEAANMCIEALQGELALLQQVHEKAKDGLRSKTQAEEALSQQVSQLQGHLGSCQQELKALQGTHAATKEELAAALERSAALEAKLQAAGAELESLAKQLAELRRAKEEEIAELKRLREAEVSELKRLREADIAAWTEERAALKAAIQAATEREAALAEEKSALKAALAAALAAKEQLEMAASQSARELSALNNECVNLKHQVEFVSGQQADAEAQAEAAREALAKVEENLKAAHEQLTVKQERLSVLEGEFDALKEVLGEAGGQRDVVAGLLSKISSLQGAVAAAEATRRKLHNELVSIRGNIRVYCRVKPHPSPVVKLGADQASITINVDGKEHPFGYDRVFGPANSQEEVFGGVSELVQSALDGYHVCLFSYGQTGAGKTYTMQGVDGPTGRGIIPRAVEKILDTAARLRDECEWEYSMEASFVEVYNNALRDLLGGPGAPYINDQSAIKHDPAGGHTTVVGVSKVPVTDAAGAETLIRRAAASRACEATAMNAESSRSHVVFMLYITGAHAPTGTRLQGCLCLVDLAGSERLDRSQAEDARKKEACAINQSLSALGDIFAALSARSGHVPYRNSKLTYLLQPCLGGQGKTLMFVNINPEPASAFESLCSLKFAAKVNGCETAAKGGAKRNAMGGLVPTAMAASASGAGAAGGDSKRFSLPGPPKPPAMQGVTDSKRMSMYQGSTGASSAAGAAAAAGAPKRPPTGSSSGMPPTGSMPKRVRQ